MKHILSSCGKTYLIRLLFLTAVIWVVFSFPAGTQPGPLRAELSLDSSRILLGDQIYLHIETEAGNDTKLFFPVFGESITHGVEVLRSLPVDSMPAGRDRTRYRASYLITSFDSGFHFIPALAVVVQQQDGQDTVFTRSMPLEVLALPPDTSVFIYDIKMPYKAPLTFREILPYVGVALLTALLLFMVVRYYRKRKKKQNGLVHPSVPARPPYETAIRELEALQKEKFWQQGRVKDYHSRLTEIIRVYIEGRFGLAAMEQTTGETLEGLKGPGAVSDSSLDMLGQILGLADMVKFARAQPLPDEHVNAMARAIRFVQDTRPEAGPANFQGEELPAHAVNVTGSSGQEKIKTQNVVQE